MKTIQLRLYGGDGVRICPHVKIVEAEKSDEGFPSCEYIETAKIRCGVCEKTILVEIAVN